MTPRLPDWQARLGALLEQRTPMPFAWGINDCCMFAADAVLACTGVDPGAAHRGNYSDASGGARTLQNLGGVAGVGDALFGAPVAPLAARVGDIGLVRVSDRDALAVCNGATWLAPGEKGLVALPLAAATRAWRY